MTNDELRQRIAELKGYKPAYEDMFGNLGEGWFYDPDGKICIPPDWATDPRAALELVEEMHLNFYSVRISAISNFMTDIPWTVRLYAENKEYCADADTFCRAVCVAWIAWKEAQS